VGSLQGTPAPAALQRLASLFVGVPAAALLAALLALLALMLAVRKGTQSNKEYQA
jgi:hypothetical protein